MVDYVKNRKEKVHSWFMDRGLILNYWGSTTRTYHHTAPINGLFALHEALLLLREETLERAWERHTRHYLAFKAGLEAMGLKFLVREDARLPQMSAVYVPKGVNEAEVRRSLLSEFNLEIGAGLGPLAGKVWRFGLMGYSCKPENVMLCLSALGSVLMDAGLPIEVGGRGGRASFVALQHSTRGAAGAEQLRRRSSAVRWPRRYRVRVLHVVVSVRGCFGGDPPPEVKREVGARASRKLTLPPRKR